MRTLLIRLLCALTRMFPPLSLDRLAARFHPEQVGGAEHSIRYGASRVCVRWTNRREWDLYATGLYEPHVTRMLRRHAPPGGYAIDVGANLGLHTLTLSRAVGTMGRVLALEPNPPVRARLEQNLALNPHARNVTVDPRGASDRAGTAHLHTPEGDPITGKGSLVAHNAPGWINTSVAVETVDSIVAALGWPRVDLIKVDVEGHDLPVLRGAAGILERHRPALVIEYEPPLWQAAGYSFAGLVDLLQPLGYRLWFLPPDRWRGLRRSAPVALGNSVPAALASRPLDVIALPA